MGGFIETVRVAVHVRRNIVRPHILPYILLYMDRIRDLDERECSYRGFIIEAWTSLIHQCHMSEAFLRGQERERSLLLSNGLDGCSWYQCIFHGGEAKGAVARMMLFDGVCGKVQYCSLACQKKDWHQGLHKSACRPPAVLPRSK